MMRSISTRWDPVYGSSGKPDQGRAGGAAWLRSPDPNLPLYLYLTARLKMYSTTLTGTMDAKRLVIGVSYVRM